MDELIIQVISGNATPSAEERVRLWRGESEENEAHYQDTARVWSVTEPVTGRASPQPVDTAVILAAAEERRRSQDRSGVVPISRTRSRFGLGRVARWSVAAAAGIAALALGLRMDLLSPDPQPMASYVARGGTPSTVPLDDGSFVKLAPGSSLEVWDSEQERRVSLSGRAFFAVAHEEARPFVVQSRNTETRVLGTRFEVSETEGSVRTVVVDGLVAMSNEQGSVDVPAGSLARTLEGSAPTTETPDDIYAFLDWPMGVMLFQGTPLAQVATEVGRSFDRAVEVRGDALRALRISGTFEEESFEEVVLALCETAGAECALTEDGVTIGR